jgi:hypothetical protein
MRKFAVLIHMMMATDDGCRLNSPVIFISDSNYDLYKVPLECVTITRNHGLLNLNCAALITAVTMDLLVPTGYGNTL